MKATIKFKDYNGASRQKTIMVEKNEVNSIIREFIRITKRSRFTYITTVKCGRTEYQWFGEATGAGIY